MFAFKAILCILSALLTCVAVPLASIHHEHNHHGIQHPRKTISSPVKVTEEHAFIPPAPGQQRGPCPALNALANHAYISRDGIVSLLEAVNGITTVFDMDVDLATELAVMAVVWTGDALSLDPSFSIGGSDARVSGPVGSLQGTTGPAQGLAKAHNFLEADSSPTRNDLYVTGDAATMNLTRFEKLYNLVPTHRAFTMDDIADFAVIRFRESVEENKDFYYGPFAGGVARNAGFCFVGRLLANHSEGDAEGTLTHGILKSFYAVTGDDPSSFTYKRGWERIPENWYRGPGGYGIAEISLDIISMIVKHPEMGNIGGNTGTTDSFAGVDLADPVSGLANIPSLLESNNLMCFALELVKGAVPSTANSLFATLAEPLTKLVDAVDASLLSLACPAWPSVREGGQSFLKRLQATYPGAKRSAL